MEDRTTLNRNLAQMLKGGVIMDVTTPEQARIAEAAGACAVMALERIPADIRAAGGVSRMSDPKMIKGIQEAVSIPVMAKCRIGHFVEAQILEAKNVISKKNMMRLNKKADETRRTKLIAYQMAKAADDPNWKKLVRYQKLRKECIQKIMDKYGNKAAKIAVKAQKEYIKTAGKVKEAKNS